MIRPNFTRATYEVFSQHPAYEDDLLAELERRQVPVVVLNSWTTGAWRFSPEFLRQIGKRYPRVDTVGRFVVRSR